MEFEKLIEERRSIRKYDSSRRATKEQITAMVQAAIQAPSWKNSQTARYYAVLEEARCEEFSESCLPQFNRDSSKGASYLVTTFVNLSKTGQAITERPERRIMNAETAGAITTWACRMRT